MVNSIDLPKSILPKLHAYIATTCNNHNSPAIIVNGTHDHVHILCHLSKNISISKLLEEIKTDSSKWIKTLANDFGYTLNNFSWQKGYGAFSVSASQVEIATQYIHDQERHHLRKTFKEEYLELLKKYNVKFDEKYLWV
jgi:REP element-mobilizing transposase RayT